MHLYERPRIEPVVRAGQCRRRAGRASAVQLVIEGRATRSDNDLVGLVLEGPGGIGFLGDIRDVLMAAEVGGAILSNDFPEGIAQAERRRCIETAGGDTAVARGQVVVGE